MRKGWSGPEIADRRYRETGAPNAYGFIPEHPACFRQAANLVEEVRVEWATAEPNSLHAKSPIQYRAAVFNPPRECGDWVQWVPGKSLAEHMPVDAPNWFHHVPTLVQLLAGLATAGLGITAAYNALSRYFDR